jgi:UDP-N-acetylmuramoyl-tripeptide--D-alanyl-D-alanine ligase
MATLWGAHASRVLLAATRRETPFSFSLPGSRSGARESWVLFEVNSTLINMDPLSLSRIAQLANGVLAQGDAQKIVSRLSTDSRTLQSGDLFVALRGENFDGHKFVEQADERGAVGAMVEESWKGTIAESFALIRVPDTLRGYQNLAANYRRSLPLEVIAITGSNGKTSTKDFVAATLARGYRVTKTEGNFNNHVGLPQTMLTASSSDEVAVWEIGMNHPGEIAALAKLAAPDAAIITNVGLAHIEFMGSREAIAAEKGALAEAVGAEGTVILNADDPFSQGVAERTRAKVIFAGIEKGSVQASEVRQSPTGCEFTILEGAHRCRAQLPVPGIHMVQNAILAVAAGRAFGLSLEDCAAGLASAPLTKARLQIKEINGIQFIDDSYNANPDSMKAALRTLVELDADGRRIAVLGQMNELGEESERRHREVGEAAAELGIDELIAVGATGAAIARAAQKAGLKKCLSVTSPGEAARILGETALPGDLILVKGSRSARMERVLEAFSQRQPTAEVTP